MTVHVNSYDRSTGPVREHDRSNPGSSGGGSGKGGAGAVVVAVGIAVAVGAGPGGATLFEGSVPSASGRVPSNAVKLEAQTKKTKVTANLNGVKVRWQNRGYQVTTRVEPEFDCAAHSYGQVQDFFASHNCDYVVRTVSEFRDKSGNVILVAFSWVDMPTTSEATRFKSLVDTEGTGNVTELSREQGRYRNVRYTALGYQSGISDQGVWNVQVQPVGWSPAAVLVNELRDQVLAAGLV